MRSKFVKMVPSLARFVAKQNAMGDINAVPTNSYAIHFLKQNEKKEEKTVKMSDAIKNLDTLIHLKEDLLEMRNRKTDMLVKAIETVDSSQGSFFFF